MKRKREITFCPPIVCPKNTLLTCGLKICTLPLEVSSIGLRLPTSIQNRDKFVFLLPFYVSLLSKHKKLKNYMYKLDYQNYVREWVMDLTIHLSEKT